MKSSDLQTESPPVKTAPSEIEAIQDFGRKSLSKQEGTMFAHGNYQCDPRCFIFGFTILRRM